LSHGFQLVVDIMEGHMSNRQNEGQRVPARRVHGFSAAVFFECKLFRGRGLSDRTIERLVECGIEAPERLLFMEESALEKIPGIGKGAMAEIKAYQEKFKC
jgi:hypothetical protein